MFHLMIRITKPKEKLPIRGQMANQWESHDSSSSTLAFNEAPYINNNTVTKIMLCL